MANVKLSQIVSGGSLNSSTDTAVAVRNGTTDVLVSFSAVASSGAASDLLGTSLASNVVASSLTSVGTLTNLTVTNPIAGSVTGSSGSTTGNAATATILQTARTINGVSFDGSGNITITASPPTAGNLTDAGTDGITITGGTGAVIGSGTSIAQHVADTTHSGYLSSTDWNTFNGKQAAGNYITALTGDGSASGPGSSALTLATVNTNIGSFGTATQVSTFTVNGKGLITAAANTSIQIAESQVTNLTTDLAGKQGTLTLTTTGTSGASTLVGNTLNIPNYSTGGGSGTVTSVDVSGGTTGLTTSGGPVTSSGVITLAGTLDAANGGTGTTNTGTLAFSGSASVTGTNTGDQTTITGNAGTATKWQTARLLAGNSVDGSANVAFANKFIVQGTTDAGLTGAQFLGALTTGIVKNTTTTGVLTIAVAGTDYEVPLTFSTGLTRSTNTITVNTSQNISTLSNLTTNGLIKTSGGTGALSIATAGTDYQAPITLTTTGTSGAATFISNTLNIPQYAGTTYTAGTGLTLTAGAFSVNTSQNITTLSNLTSNGIVTTSGGTGALSVTGTTGSGNVVLATSATLITPALGTPTALVGTNITGTGAGFTSGITDALASATTTVNVSSATAPTSGQVLTATGGTAATWQTPSSGGTPGGSNTQLQYNNSGAFGGATWTYNNSTAALTGTSASASALAIGPNGATNPAFQVDASTASSATGIVVKSAAAGAGVTVTALSGGTNEALTLTAKGSGTSTLGNGGGSISLMGATTINNGGSIASFSAFGALFQNNLHSFTSATAYAFSTVGTSGGSVSAEIISMDLNFAATQNHQTGNITTNRDLILRTCTHTFSAASTIATAAGMSITGAPIAGNFATITNSIALNIEAVNCVTGTGAVVNSYGLFVNPMTGATNNFAAGFAGNVTLTGTLNPNSGLVGITSGGAASAGIVGEVITNSASGVSITSNTFANATSISLTAGQWLVFGSFGFAGTSTTSFTDYIGSISSTSVTQGTESFREIRAASVPGTSSQQFAAPTATFNLSTTTTIYMVVRAIFSLSTATALGNITAIRIR